MGLVAFSAALLAGKPAAADALQRTSGQDGTAYMRVHGATPPPYGFVEFCERQPGECTTGQAEEQRFDATPVRLAELDEINRLVNRGIEPATDLELYGVKEYWTLPINGRGDCEDYALLKRKMLMARGWPASALLMTVVRDEKGEGHAVLTARTAQGDFILDNKAETIKVWNKTPYAYLMRQSYINPRIWMALTPTDPGITDQIAGVRSRR